MSSLKITIVDYGLGNLFSIQRAISFLGYESLITNDHQDIKESDRIILPGVGAFGDGMRELKDKGLDQTLIECAQLGKMILGICLGMQLLMSHSEEFGSHDGLNIIAGDVKRFPSPKPKGIQYKIPHVGWNQIFPYGNQQSSWENTSLCSNKAGDFVYFVHSLRVIPENEEHILASTEYGGIEFCSIVKKDNVIGCQFHPELSGKIGLKIYDEFLKSESVSADGRREESKQLS